MHSIIETAPYLASAKDQHVSADERQAIVDYIAANPDAGVIMAGTGGARKIRFAGRGKGKSGGYRIITFYAADDIPVFLLDIYSKDTQANLSKAEQNQLRQVLAVLPDLYRETVKQQAKKIRREP